MEVEDASAIAALNERKERARGAGTTKCRNCLWALPSSGARFRAKMIHQEQPINFCSRECYAKHRSWLISRGFYKVHSGAHARDV